MRTNMILGGNGLRRKPGLAFGGGVPFPTGLDGNPTLLASWDFDREDLVTLGANGEITAIAGADGTAHALSKTTNGPTAKQSQYGRVVGEMGNAANGSRSIGALSACGAVVANGVTHVVLFQIPTGTGDERIIGQGNGAAPDYDDRWYTRFVPVGGGVLVEKCQTGSHIYRSQTPASNTAPILAITRFEPATPGFGYINVNGQTTLATSTSNNPVTVINYTQLGGERRNNTWIHGMNGLVYRAAILDGVISNTACEQIAAAFAAGYGNAALNV